MPAYTIQRDLPRVSERVSTAPTESSVHSDENGDCPRPIAVPPLKAKTSYHPSYHAHPRQQVNDHGPEARVSRLPVFKQVRSMLNKPPPLATPGNPKWDDYTGELSENGKPPSVKPSAYISPYEGAFEANRSRSPHRRTKSRKSNKSGKSTSPVSVLRHSEIYTDETPLPGHDDMNEWSPVSPVSPILPLGEGDAIEGDLSMIPKPLTPNVQRMLPQQTPPSSIQIKRKPAPRTASTLENQPPAPSPQHSRSTSSDMDDQAVDNKDVEPRRRGTYLSWTTDAPTLAPGRQSTDTTASRQTNPSPALSQNGFQPPQSRFSWSTVATNTTNQPARPASPPPSPPPPIPEKYSSAQGVPMQSILSRQRPVKRIEKEEWAPSPRTTSFGTPRSGTPKGSNTPTAAHTARPLPLPKDNAYSSHSPSSGKALPLPPSLSQAHQLTHLQSLIAQEGSIQLQRRNVEKGIAELEKIEKASPMEVSFNLVRDAKKRLAELRARLAEVRLEERDVGIAITRARLREEKENGGDGECLWVRRVTG